MFLVRQQTLLGKGDCRYRTLFYLIETIFSINVRFLANFIDLDKTH